MGAKIHIIIDHNVSSITSIILNSILHICKSSNNNNADDDSTDFFIVEYLFVEDRIDF